MSGGKEDKKGGKRSVPTSCPRWGTLRVYSLKEALSQPARRGLVSPGSRCLLSVWKNCVQITSVFSFPLAGMRACLMSVLCCRHRASSWLQPYWLQGVWDSGGTCVTLLARSHLILKKSPVRQPRQLSFHAVCLPVVCGGRVLSAVGAPAEHPAWSLHEGDVSVVASIPHHPFIQVGR